MGKEIMVIKDYGEIPKINCYPNELNQVFMSLLRNAVQAIEGKGTIEIKTFTENDDLNIRILDTGKGIPPEKMEMLFDLHFSLKDSRIGMATGLANAFHTIQKHHGSIKVESELGKGSEFIITLPMNKN